MLPEGVSTVFLKHYPTSNFLCMLDGSVLRGWCAALQVRSKALIQYTAPFISVNLQTMAQAFGTEVG